MDGLVFDLQNIIKIFIKEKNDKIEQIVQFWKQIVRSSIAIMKTF